MEEYLRSTKYIDSDHSKVKEYALSHSKKENNDRENAVSLYYAIRDDFKYTPYEIELRKSKVRSSLVLEKTSGNCIEKASLLTACARYLGIPSRLHLVDVRNHIATERLEAFFGSNLLVCHGYSEFYLDGKWVAATPAFNKGLCDMLNVDVLEFDGIHDSIFQEFDKSNNSFMKYEKDHGPFSDVPLDFIVMQLKAHYPHLFDKKLKRDFQFYFDE